MADFYWVGGGAGSRSGTWNGTNLTVWQVGGSTPTAAPTTSDNVFFDQNETYTVTTGTNARSKNFTVSNGTVTFTCTATLQTAGNILFSANTTLNFNSGVSWNLGSTASFTFTGNGASINFYNTVGSAVTNLSIGGILTFLDDVTFNYAVMYVAYNTTLNINGKKIKVAALSTASLTTTTYIPTIAWGTNGEIIITGKSLSSNNYQAFWMYNVCTFTGTGIFRIQPNYATTGSISFDPSAYTHNFNAKIIFDVSQVPDVSTTSYLLIANAGSTLTILDLQAVGFTNPTQSKTLKVSFDNSTDTIYTTDFSFNGSSNYKTLLLSGKISKTSGTVNVSYLQLQSSVVTGGATWKAPILQGNVNLGGNSGWDFSSSSNNFLMLFR